jgi:nanoRNase/pAp phosphatase (c-di-AMP/oligoRNAs hydrolase)
MEIARRTMMLHYGTFDPESNYDGENCIVIDLVNAPPMYSSDIGSIIAKEKVFGGTYYDTATHREFSLRSVGDFDVSEIAKSFGGGGHKNAAGFKVPRSHPFARL